MRRVLIGIVLAELAACGQLLDIDGLVDRVDASAGETGADASPDVVGVDASVEGACASQGQCDPFPQCGCNANESCVVFDTSGNTACVDAGPLGAWASCTYKDDCQKGMECIGFACKPFCADASDCVGTNVTCEQIKNPPNTGKDIPGLVVCSSGCDPHDPSAICGANVGCYPQPWPDKGPYHGDCFGHAKGGMGPGACATDMFACAPGWGCISGDCEAWCRITSNDCPTNQVCVPLDPAAIVAGVEYGVCK